MRYLDRLQNAMALAANAVVRKSQSRAETKKQCILCKLVDQGPWSTSVAKWATNNRKERGHEKERNKHVLVACIFNNYK